MSDHDSPSALPPDVIAAIKQTFDQECEEHLATLEAGLLDLKRGASDTDIINTMFRAAHSIKGGAAIFGMQRLVTFAHKLESALSFYRSGHTLPNPEVIDTLLRVVDSLSDISRAGDAVFEREDEGTRELLAALDAVAHLEQEASSEGDCEEIVFTPQRVVLEEQTTPARRWAVHFKPLRELYARACEPLFLLRELQSLGKIVVSLDESSVPLLAELDPAEPYLHWTIGLETVADEQQIRDVFEFVESDSELHIRLEEAIPSLAASATYGSVVPVATSTTENDPIQTNVRSPTIPRTIRVDVDRVDRLVNLIGELVISEAALSESVSDSLASRNTQVSDALDALRLLTRDLQEGVMAIRAQPVKTVFRRLPRMVRELEAQTGKRVELVLEGEDTEIDRTVIEGLIDPLAHLIRNAIDHGIETSEIRSRAGKSSAGQVRVSAAHRAGRIIIEIADDGGGIDRERVLGIAIERGLVGAGAILDRVEIDALIFEPGFSTSHTISSVSGRGVGMDVVKRGIQALGGRIGVLSERGTGTTVTLSLPLTLAVLDGMLFTSGGQHLVIPLASLLETVQLTRANVRRFGAGSNILTVRGAHVPLIDLGAMLGFRAAGNIPDAGIALLVEDDARQRLAMLIDDIQGQRQVVIKTLERNYGAVDGVAAATILGNGNVALILDVNAIIASRKSGPLERLAANG